MDKEFNLLCNKSNDNERRNDEVLKLSDWEQYLNKAQLYTLGRLRNFGYDLKFVRYNSENLAIFSKDAEFEEVIAVDQEGDFEVNPNIKIRK